MHIQQPQNHLLTSAGLVKPKHLASGDTIATVSLSWGGASELPHRYKAGKEYIEKVFGLNVVAMPNSLRSAEFIKNNPKARADDLMQAFQDPKIAGIISNIGGIDSIRMLRYLDYEIIKANPKPFLGYSDSTVTHFACYKAGIVSYYGPSILSGFAENCGMHDYSANSFRNVLCSNRVLGTIPQNQEGWTVQILEWSVPSNQQIRRKLNPCEGWRFINGSGVVKGHLMGGCMEVLDWLRGLDEWPAKSKWQNAILFIETSEDAPTPAMLESFLRCLAELDILPNLSGILFGRPGGGLTNEKFLEYDQSILQVVVNEYGLINMPVVTNMDFGHTDPIMTLPLGVMAEINLDNKTVSLIESACS